MEKEKLAFSNALADIAHRFTMIDSEKHPNLITFDHNHYYVVCNEDMFEEYEDFIATNSETLKEIFPKQFKCFKLDDMLTAKLMLISKRCKENYEILCGTKFAIIEDKLYAIKMLSCNKPKEGLGFVLMKYDLIEDDRSLGSFMFLNKSANYLLNELGGICLPRFNVLKANGIGMVDLIASDAYVKNNPGVSDDNVYVDAGSYKLPNFDTIDSVKIWIGTDGSEKCPYINICRIESLSKHLRIRKWIAERIHQISHSLQIYKESNLR